VSSVNSDPDVTLINPIRVVEMKLPLTWLLSTATVVIMAMAGLVFQLNIATGGIAELKSSMIELKLAQEKRDERMNLFSGSNIEMRSQLNNVQLEMTRISNDVNELRRDSRIQQRYMPLK